MQVTERDKELLAELSQMTSFVLLMKIFQEFENDVLDELAGEKNPASLVRISRFYQCMRSIREFLQSVPASAQAELERMRMAYLYDETGLPVDPIRARFNPEPQESESE